MNAWIVPGYTEIRQLGAGGSGRVMLATHDATGTPVAIKYLSDDLVRYDDFVDEFRAEAQILSELESPYVTRLYEYLEADGRAAIVMELVDGDYFTAPETNQVVLTVADAAKGTEALLAAAASLGDRVRVERVAGEMHTAIYNGEAITGGGTRCSVGFNTNRGGQNYILDAGHCTRAVSQWNVGPSQGSSFPGNDYGLIRNTTGSAPGAVTLWNGSTQRISSAGTATVGQRISKSGSTTHLTSGSVTRTNVTVNYAEGSVSQLIQTNALVNPGDSGGCLFAGSVGLGITSGKGSGTSFFQPVGEAMSAYGVSLN